MHEANNIAVLFFSRNAPEEGKKKTWFCSNERKRNSDLASSLINHSSEFLNESGFPVYHYHEGNQRGTEFGERLANAYHDLFELGYSGVIAVGNDSPEIVKTDLKRVGEDLLSGKCVLGPSFRGGAYLIGITRSRFEKTGFQNLPWQSNNLFDSLYQYCFAGIDVPVILDTLRDLNSLHDLRILLKKSPLKAAFRTLIVFLKTKSKKFYRETNLSLPASYHLTYSAFRAPPNVLN